MALLPVEYRFVFDEFASLKCDQQPFLDDCFETDSNILITGPTGSGKELAFDVAILRLIDQFKAKNDFKAIYLAPSQPQCNAKASRWTDALAKLNINTLELVENKHSLPDLSTFQLILSTPETWNGISKFRKNHLSIMSSIRLIMIDDLFLLNEPSRGSTLEAVISRMKFIDNFLNFDSPSMRFLAVSCSFSNVQDIVEWLGGGSKVHEIPANQRQVPLETHVFGSPLHPNCSNYQFDMQLTYKLEQYLSQYRCPRRSTLVFCSTRRGVEHTAQHLSKLFMGSNLLSDSQVAAISGIQYRVQQKKLLEVLKTGVAYYHAGLSFDDRSTIEDLFNAGQLPILVSTNSMTVNFKAYLVIIKSTNMYGSAAESTEYSSVDILNMVARAGQKEANDPKGVALILTQAENVEKYKSLVIYGSTPIGSNLYENLVEHLNAEIVLETVANLGDAMTWLRSTFFYVRAIRRQVVLETGGASAASATMDDEGKIEKCLRAACEGALKSLQDNLLIEKDEAGDWICSTANGRLFSKHTVSIDSMRLLYQINGTETLGELLDIVCRMHEFKVFKLRATDRNTLNGLNSGRGGGGGIEGVDKALRFPLEGKIATVPMKISCLLQTMLGNVIVGDSETTKIYNIALRLVRFVYEFVKIKAITNGEGSFKVLANALILLKCFEVRMWENSVRMLSQLPKIGPASVKSFAAAGIQSFDQLLRANPRDIEKILKRSAPFGDEIHGMVQSLPTYFLTLHKCLSPPMMGMDGGASALAASVASAAGNDQSRCIEMQLERRRRQHDATAINRGCTSIKVNVKRLLSLDSEEPNLNDEISLMIGDAKTNRLLFYKEHLQVMFKSKLSIDFQVDIGQPAHQTTIIVAHLIHHSIVGLDQRKMLTVNEERQRMSDAAGALKGSLGGGGDALKRARSVDQEDIAFVLPQKLVKGSVEGFQIDDIFSSSFVDKEDDDDTGKEDQGNQETDELEPAFAARSQRNIENRSRSTTLLSLMEARDRWSNNTRSVSSLDEVLHRITGKQGANEGTKKTDMNFKDLMKTNDAEDEEGQQRGRKRVEVFENLRIFFE